MRRSSPTVSSLIRHSMRVLAHHERNMHLKNLFFILKRWRAGETLMTVLAACMLTLAGWRPCATISESRWPVTWPRPTRS